MQDFSKDNPKLHRLYVLYAQEELKVINEAIEKLESLSRVNPHIIAGQLYQERAKLLKGDAAYQEACWRMLADDLVVEDGS